MPRRSTRRAASAERSRRSYANNKSRVARARILSRIQVGRCVQPRTRDDPKYGWTEEERAMMDRCMLNRRRLYHRAPEEITEVRDRRYRFARPAPQEEVPAPQEEVPAPQEEVPAPQEEVPAPQEEVILEEDVKELYAYKVHTGMLMRGKNDVAKARAIASYKSRIAVLFQILGTRNLLDVYRHPLVYTRRLAESGYKDVKDYLAIVTATYNKSDKLPANARISPVIRRLKTIVPPDTVGALRDALNLAIANAKRRAADRSMDDPYYEWPAIAGLLEGVRGNDVRALRDKVVLSIYVNDHVVRDNLGLVELSRTAPRRDALYNTLHIRGRRDFVFYMYDFKNQSMFKDYKFTLSAATSTHVRNYLDAMTERLGSLPSHLVTKADGTPYAGGSLSSYVSAMFRRLTGKKVTIGDLRHSVATYALTQGWSEARKRRLAYKMQHSYEVHLTYERHSGVTIPIEIRRKN